MTPDKEGNLPPSALVPFCSYQGNSSMLGQERVELANLTVCDKFEPTILDGQLCYSLDTAKLGKKPTKSGKANGIFLLLDPNPYQLYKTEKSFRLSRSQEQSFKVFIHTLAQYTTFGSGSYGMSALKKMTGTESFKKLPVKQKKCLVHNREECQTRKYLDQVQNKCKCTPWPLETQHATNQVKNEAYHRFIIIWMQNNLTQTGNLYNSHLLGFRHLWPREGELCWKPNLERRKLFDSLHRTLC